jgi:predicted AlkP superfamily pyrophosphatase or phosphodiesterase
MKNPRVLSSFVAVLFSIVLVTSPALAGDVDLRVPKNQLAQPISYEAFSQKPKLVVVMVIDQFRADYLTRFAKRFLPAKEKNGSLGGFQYLMSFGAYFPFARYDILENMTCAGHAMILSGSYPYASSIVLNEYFDQALGRDAYCVEDHASPVINPPEKTKGSQADQPWGVSPRAFIGSTVGDELKGVESSSRVVALALKDRAAILLGGHRPDLAFWLDEDFQWTSSQYYLPKMVLPGFLVKLNTGLADRRGKDLEWMDKKTKIGSFESLESPLGGEVTIDAALAALKFYKLGAGTAPDILAVSLSAHDLLGHRVGPNAPEMEELTVSEDQAIAKLLNGIAKQVPGGLKDVTLVLTADHGMAPTVPYQKQAQVDSDFIDQKKLVTKIENELVSKFGEVKDGKWVLSVRSFNFYLNHKAMSDKKLNEGAVEAIAKEIVAQETGVAFVVTRSEIEAGRFPPGVFERELRKSFVPKKSGDVILIPLPYYMEKGNPATHMTGYSYDRTVPLIIAGPRIEKGVYAESVEVIDLAPTLSFLLGVLPPAQSEGRVLSEIIR